MARPLDELWWRYPMANPRNRWTVEELQLFRGCSVATCGMRFGSIGSLFRQGPIPQDILLAWTLCMKRSFPARDLITFGPGPLQVVAEVCRVRRFTANAPARVWGLTEEDRGRLLACVLGDPGRAAGTAPESHFRRPKRKELLNAHRD